LHLAEFPTTNHYGATTVGPVPAYRVGADLCDIDTAQYHSTGVAYPEAILGELIMKECRGLGAQLVSASSELFIYELDPRDVVASAIIRECVKGRRVATPIGACGVCLDLPMMEELQSPGTIKKPSQQCIIRSCARVRTLRKNLY